MKPSINIVNKLTLRHLRLNRGRTAITLLGIALSVAMVCCVAGFVMSMRDLLLREVRDKTGNYHVVFSDVTTETADAIISEDIFVADSARLDDGGVGGLPELFLRLKSPGRDILEQVGAVAERHGAASFNLNRELLALESGVITNDRVLQTFVVVAGIAITVIVIGSTVVIANAFSISSAERARQFGMLKSVGATGGQLGRSVLFEASVLTAAAIPVGVFLGFLIQIAVLRLTNNLLDEVASQFSADTTFNVIFDPLVVLFAAAVAVVTVFLSAWAPARRAAAASPIDAIRQAKEISIRPGSDEKKVSAITTRLFGFEGALAAKTLKRNRSKYRAAVVSLTLSIILFVSMSSFVWTLNKAVAMEYGGYDYDVGIYTTGQLEPIEMAEAALRAVPGAKMVKSLVYILETAVPDGFVTENADRTETVGNGYGMLLHAMPDAEISQYLDPGMTRNGAGADGGVAGVLVNTAALDRDGRKMEVTPFNCDVGVELPMLLGNVEGGETPDEIGKLTVGSVVTEIPGDIPASLFDDSLINIYIPESDYRELFYDSANNRATYAVTTADPEGFSEEAIEVLESVAFDKGYGYGLSNVAQMTRLFRNITLIVMLFGYGFIAMLSLISVTSVVTTISTSMALRRREFAMLYSVGMTPEGMNKTLNLESLMYGLKSLLIGLPVGVALSALIYRAMNSTFSFAYEPPVAAMLVGSAVVMGLTFSTMRYGKRKLGKISIVEAIRSETV